jgi:putative flippase GtrA
MSLARLRRSALAHQITQYVIVNFGCTLLTLALYLWFSRWMIAEAANVLAFALSTVVSSLANRAITFRRLETVSTLRFCLQNVATFLFYCTSTSMALGALGLFLARPTSTEQALAVCCASVAGGVGRFLLFRIWVFRARETGTAPAVPRFWSPSRSGASR